MFTTRQRSNLFVSGLNLNWGEPLFLIDCELAAGLPYLWLTLPVVLGGDFWFLIGDLIGDF